MAILRNRTQNFTIIENVALNDERLSLKAVGLLCKMLSLPDYWDFSEKGLCAIFKKDGLTSIRSGLKELEEAGYLRREQVREKGKFLDWVWEVYSTPQVEKPKSDFPKSVNPKSESKSNKSLKETSTNQPITKQDIRHKHGEYMNVLLSDEDMEKLKTEFPDDWSERIESLSSYMASTGKAYKNHLATIRNWAKRDKQKAESKQKKEMTYDEMVGDTEEWPSWEMI